MNRKFIPIAFMTAAALFLTSGTKGLAEARNHVLIFQMSEFNPLLKDTVDFFFEKVLGPEDGLVIVTPVKPYKLSPETRSKYPQEKLVEAVTGYLKRDLSHYGNGINMILQALWNYVQDIARALTGEADPALQTYFTGYRQTLIELNGQRRLGEDFFREIGDSFNNAQIPTRIFVFLEQGFRPIPDREIMELINKNNDLKLYTMELFTEGQKSRSFEVGDVGQIFVQNNIRVDIIYLRTERKLMRFVEFLEYTDGDLDIMNELANFTGGVMKSSVNPKEALKKVLK